MYQENGRLMDSLRKQRLTFYWHLFRMIDSKYLTTDRKFRIVMQWHSNFFQKDLERTESSREEEPDHFGPNNYKLQIDNFRGFHEKLKHNGWKN